MCKNKEVISVLIEALQDEDSEVGEYATWALRKIGSKDRSLVRNLVETLKDCQGDITRNYVILILSEVGRSVENMLAIIDLLKDPREETRESAAEILLMIGKASIEFWIKADVFADALNDENFTVRRAAVSFLRQLLLLQPKDMDRSYLFQETERIKSLIIKELKKERHQLNSDQDLIEFVEDNVCLPPMKEPLPLICPRVKFESQSIELEKEKEIEAPAVEASLVFIDPPVADPAIERAKKFYEKQKGKFLLNPDREILPDGTVVVALTIPHILSAATMSKLEEELTNYHNKEIFTVILDFSKVEQIRYENIKILIRFQKLFLQQGGELKLANLSSSTLATFEEMEAAELFAIYDTREEALGTKTVIEEKEELREEKIAKVLEKLDEAEPPKLQKSQEKIKPVKLKKKILPKLTVTRQEIIHAERELEITRELKRRKAKKEKRVLVKQDEEKQSRKISIPNFEKSLSQDAGRPGPIEAFIGRSKKLIRFLQITIGLKCLLVVNAIDAFIELMVHYIQGILFAWKMLKAIERKLKRNFSKNEMRALWQDVAVGRFKLSKILGLTGFECQEYEAIFMTEEDWTTLNEKNLSFKNYHRNSCPFR